MGNSGSSSSHEGYEPIIDRTFVPRNSFEALNDDEPSPLERYTFDHPFKWTLILFGFIVLLYSIIFMAVVVRRTTAAPPVLAASAAATVFSASRAFPMAFDLSNEIGARPLGSVALINATQYVRSRCDSIVLLAQSNGWSASSVAVHTASGAVLAPQAVLSFTDVPLVLTLLQRTGTEPLLLIAARMDSSFLSPAAASGASATATVLEVARALAAQPAGAGLGVAVALVGAGDGRGAAAVCTALGSRVAAFITVDGFGTGAASALISALGAYASSVYYGTAVYPHAPLPVRDLQRVGLTLGTFSEFSAYGQCLPGRSGLELQWYQEGYTYNTPLESSDMLSPPALQHMGDNLLSAARGMLARPPSAANSTDDAAPLLYDLLQGPLLWVSRPALLAAGIVVAVLGLAVALMQALAVPIEPVRSRLLWLLVATLCGLLSLVCAGGLALFLAGFFSWSGPIAWFRSIYFALFLFAPAVLFGATLGQWALHSAFVRAAPSTQRLGVRASRLSRAGLLAVLAIGLAVSLPLSDTAALALLWWLGFALVAYGLGTGLQLAVSLVQQYCFGIAKPTSEEMDFWPLVLLVSVIPPALLSTDWLLALLSVLLPVAGRFGQGVLSPELNPVGLHVYSLPMRPDVLVGLLSAAFMFVALTPALPFLHRAGATLSSIPKGTGRSMLSTPVRAVPFGWIVLVCGVAAVSTLVLAAVPPYSLRTPQRLHFTHRADVVDGTLTRTRLSVSALDERGPSEALRAALGEPALANWTCQYRSYCQYTGVDLPPPPLTAPTLLVRRDQIEPGTGNRLLELEISNLGTFFTAVAVRAPLQYVEAVKTSWSLTDVLPSRNDAGEYVVNHVTADAQGAPLRLRLAVYGNRAVALRVEAHAQQLSAELQALRARLPPWATLDPHGSYATVAVNRTLAPLTV